VYAALDAIDEALEQALLAPTEREQRWQLHQLRGLLLTLRSGDLSLEDCPAAPDQAPADPDD
jgi:hypothetical protein